MVSLSWGHLTCVLNWACVYPLPVQPHQPAHCRDHCPGRWLSDVGMWTCQALLDPKGGDWAAVCLLEGATF